MSKQVDLHIHTLYSDGAYTPSQIIARAKDMGLEIISITDHDTVDGLEEAIEVGKELGIEVIPGVELSSNINGTDIHILGYFINWRDEDFRENLKIFKNMREQRARRIVKKLNEHNIKIKFEEVLEIAKSSPISRVHIASALVIEGYAENLYEAFNKYLGTTGIAYERNIEVSPKKAIKLIAKAGGLSFLAHPGKYINENDIFNLIELGIDGIEVIHPSHTDDMVKYYREVASEYFLLESGGSDFHGGLRNDETCLGHFTVSVSAVENMKHRLNAG